MENAATFDNQANIGAQPGTVRQLGEGAAEAGRQLWLAGLGLVALAGKAVRQSGQAFDLLVQEGRELEPKITSSVKEGWSEVSSTVESVGSKVPGFARRAEGEAEEQGSRINEAVKSYLERVGLATQDDIRQILSRLQSIESHLQEKVTASTGASTHAGEQAGEEEAEHDSRHRKHHRR